MLTLFHSQRQPPCSPSAPLYFSNVRGNHRQPVPAGIETACRNPSSPFHSNQAMSRKESKSLMRIAVKTRFTQLPGPMSVWHLKTYACALLWFSRLAFSYHWQQLPQKGNGSAKPIKVHIRSTRRASNAYNPSPLHPSSQPSGWSHTGSRSS